MPQHDTDDSSSAVRASPEGLFRPRAVKHYQHALHFGSPLRLPLLPGRRFAIAALIALALMCLCLVLAEREAVLGQVTTFLGWRLPKNPEDP